MTLHQLLTEESRKHGVSEADIEAAHAFSKAVIAAIGGNDKEVAQTELTPEDERMYREYIAADLDAQDRDSSRKPSAPTRTH